MTSAEDSSTTRLRASDLFFAYDDDREILGGWSHDFLPGTMTALTAPSGRGKSTLLAVLGLMLRARRGDVCIGNRSTKGLRDHQRARLRAHCFGYVFQDAALDASRTVWDNVTETTVYRGVARTAETERALHLLRQLGVSIPVDRVPGQVSGGQAQRIAMCRALLGRPGIVLADEPTGNLDTASAEAVITALRAHAEAGGVVVVATHSAAVVAACDARVGL